MKNKIRIGAGSVTKGIFCLLGMMGLLILATLISSLVKSIFGPIAAVITMILLLCAIITVIVIRGYWHDENYRLRNHPDDMRSFWKFFRQKIVVIKVNDKEV
jgi:hypothetical protein